MAFHENPTGGARVEATIAEVEDYNFNNPIVNDLLRLASRSLTEVPGWMMESAGAFYKSHQTLLRLIRGGPHGSYQEEVARSVLGFLDTISSLGISALANYIHRHPYETKWMNPRPGWISASLKQGSQVLSPKVQEAIRQISASAATDRILLFTRTRESALALCQIVEERFPDRHPG